MRIINLTQHPSSDDQREAGVFEPENKEAVQELLTFDTLPTGEDIYRVSVLLSCIAQKSNATHAMIGGAGWLIESLEYRLRVKGITPIHAFSVRESTEEVQPDGSVRKVNTFKHLGWVGL